MPVIRPVPETFIDCHRLIKAMGGGPVVQSLFRKHKQPVPTHGQIITWSHRYQIPMHWLAALVLLYETERKRPLILRNFIKIGHAPWHSKVPREKTNAPDLSELLRDMKRQHKATVEYPADDRASKRIRARQARQEKFAATITDPFAPPVPPPSPTSLIPSHTPDPTPDPASNILAEATEILKDQKKTPLPDTRRRVIDF